MIPHYRHRWQRLRTRMTHAIVYLALLGVLTTLLWYGVIGRAPQRTDGPVIAAGLRAMATAFLLPQRYSK